tara:strand:- start:2588 stop:3313 length:726 start_codon:yes stop_codon:yes gene_type:complete
MQPNVFMWGGLLKSILDSDLHIILDIVRSSKNSRYNRNKIAGAGEESWLTIPFVDFKREKLIMNQYLDTSESTKKKLINFFKSRYSDAPYYKNSLQILETSLDFNNTKTNLCLVYKNFLNALKQIGLPVCKVKFASELISFETSKKNFKGIELVNLILEKANAETYLASENTLNYASQCEYKVPKVLVQKFSAKPYSQIPFKINQSFIPNLSVLDMISYLEKDELINNLKSSNTWGESKGF